MVVCLTEKRRHCLQYFYASSECTDKVFHLHELPQRLPAWVQLARSRKAHQAPPCLTGKGQRIRSLLFRHRKGLLLELLSAFRKELEAYLTSQSHLVF